MKTTELTNHKWHSILSFFGLDNSHLTGKHTACPICGGKDRFRFDDKDGRGTYYCNQCGAGDGFNLLMKYKGWPFSKAAFEVDKIIASEGSTPAKQPRKTQWVNLGLANKERLQKQRSRMKRLGNADSVSNYLMSRGITQTTLNKLTDSLLIIPKLEYWDNGRIQGKYDAMAALVHSGDAIATHHITYLDNGGKAKVNAPRKIMPAIKPIKGGAVHLFEHDGVLGVAEGIETALSVTELYQLPTWATLNANNMQSFIVPESVTELHIFADNDASYTGQRAALELAHRATKEGIQTQLHIPSTSGTDWNDELLQSR